MGWGPEGWEGIWGPCAPHSGLGGLLWLSLLLLCRLSGVAVLPAAGPGHRAAAAPEPAALAAARLPQALHRRPLPLPALTLHPGGHETLRQLREQSPGAGPEIRALHPGRAAGARGGECAPSPAQARSCPSPAALLASPSAFPAQLWGSWMCLLCLMSCSCLCLHQGHEQLPLYQSAWTGLVHSWLQTGVQNGEELNYPSALHKSSESPGSDPFLNNNFL